MITGMWLGYCVGLVKDERCDCLSGRKKRTELFNGFFGGGKDGLARSRVVCCKLYFFGVGANPLWI